MNKIYYVTLTILVLAAFASTQGGERYLYASSNSSSGGYSFNGMTNKMFSFGSFSGGLTYGFPLYFMTDYVAEWGKASRKMTKEMGSTMVVYGEMALLTHNKSPRKMPYPFLGLKPFEIDGSSNASESIENFMKANRPYRGGRNSITPIAEKINDND